MEAQSCLAALTGSGTVVYARRDTRLHLAYRYVLPQFSYVLRPIFYKQKHHNDKHAAVSASNASTTMKSRQRVGSAAQTPNPSHNASMTAQQLRRAPVEALVPLSGQPRRRPSSSRPGSKATMIPGPVSYNAPVSTPIAPPFVSKAAPGAAQAPQVRSPPPSSHARSESNAGPELATQPRNMPIKVAAPRCPTPQPPPPPPPNSAPVEINIQARENVPNRGTAVFDASHGLPEVGVIINANGLKITVTVR